MFYSEDVYLDENSLPAQLILKHPKGVLYLTFNEQTLSVTALIGPPDWLDYMAHQSVKKRLSRKLQEFLYPLQQHLSDDLKPLLLEALLEHETLKPLLTAYILEHALTQPLTQSTPLETSSPSSDAQVLDPPPLFPLLDPDFD